MNQEDLLGRAVLTDLVDPNSKETILEKQQRLTEASVEKILESHVESFKVIYLDTAIATPVILDTLDMERTGSKKRQWSKSINACDPGENPFD